MVTSVTVIASYSCANLSWLWHYCCKEIPWPKAGWGGKGLFQLILPGYSNPLLREVMTRTHPRQAPGDRGWCRSRGGEQLTGLLLKACSACFFSTSSTGPWAQGRYHPIIHPHPSPILKKSLIINSTSDQDLHFVGLLQSQIFPIKTSVLEMYFS